MHHKSSGNKCIFWLLFILAIRLSHGQQIQIRGTVLETDSQKPIAGARVVAKGTQTMTNVQGQFSITTTQELLEIEAQGYYPKTISVQNQNRSSLLVFLELDVQEDLTTNLITLTENELEADESNVLNASGLLQATRDVFLQRAAFDFSQVFFRVRGMDSREGEVRLNGILMNKLFDGRPQWNNWGGLNDVIRNQEFSLGLEANRWATSGLIGNTNIDLRPSLMRRGWRVTSSISNRTYRNRLMITHNSSYKNRLFYSVSASRRWSNQGYIEGTAYEATAAFGALEYHINENQSLSITGIFASNTRGRSAPITQEVFELLGHQYNPNWGFQNETPRNSRLRQLQEPLVILNHYWQLPKFKMNTALAYQSGFQSRNRLYYFNAPNPDPTYYRYLPSFYINNPIGADFTNAALARDGLLANPQINWERLYQANSNNPKGAAYLLGKDVEENRLFSFAHNFQWQLSNSFQLDFGLQFRNLTSKNFAQIEDLLGAAFHVDVDPFSNTSNNLLNQNRVAEGDKFNYNYKMQVAAMEGFLQVRYQKARWQASLSGFLNHNNYQREGTFLNARYPNSSLGLGPEVGFGGSGVKTDLRYAITGRHYISLQALLQSRPPTLQNTYINPRENHKIVQNITEEKLASLNLNYRFKLPDIQGRVTGFHTLQDNLTDINFFFVDAGVGSDFVQEVISNMRHTYQGIELGLEYQASSEVTLSFAANLGQYRYANNPNIQINFDTAGAEEDFINPLGELDLGEAQLKGLRLANGPQTAIALGINYRAPKYWWMGVTANYLTQNWVAPSAIIRTDSFTLNPETGQPFAEATVENVKDLLKQTQMNPVYLLNLVGGKSWRFNGNYLSLFCSLNNAFDEVFTTGGFEQSRNGNYQQLRQDTLRDYPSFAPKFWFGFGRTFFINLAFSF